ncbi:type II secretion system F family protein [Marinactinospora thermotolerans]|uniref:type II secretion system F family protein n=1 Tax=Marinactinospora thermotolerans TaxID=531310 RepID=UPI003D8C055C
MTVWELLFAVCPTTAAVLLWGGRSQSDRRLAALSPAPPRPSRHGGGASPWRPGPLVRALLASLPAVTLVLTVGFAWGIPIGAVAAVVVWWRLGRGDPAGIRRRDTCAVSAFPVIVDLLAAVLRAGVTTSEALDAAATAATGSLRDDLRAVAERLRLGADPVAAWHGIDTPAELSALGRTLARAARTGAPVADMLERFSLECRHAARSRVITLCQRVGVLSVLPLGLCFLPAFVLIGVVPLVAGLVPTMVIP